MGKQTYGISVVSAAATTINFMVGAFFTLYGDKPYGTTAMARF